MYPVIEWKDGTVIMLDQRLLPAAEKFIVHHNHIAVAKSIKDMVIRGAPAIGIAAAMGIALGVTELQDNPEIKNPAVLGSKIQGHRGRHYRHPSNSGQSFLGSRAHGKCFP
jgi:methylthioribose-1-phosphate isomerase